GGRTAQALAGQHRALVVRGLGQEQVGRLAIGKRLGQLLELAHVGPREGGGVSKQLKQGSPGHGAVVISERCLGAT
nr:hypothetical protein [Tanacetum cinerariifolium]